MAERKKKIKKTLSKAAKAVKTALGIKETGKGRRARLKPMKTPAIFSQHRLAKETGKRGLPEQQEARRQAKKKPTSPTTNGFRDLPTMLSRSPVQRPSKRFAVGTTKPGLILPPSAPKRRRRSKSN